MKSETTELHGVRLDGSPVDITIRDGIVVAVAESKTPSETTILRDGVSLFTFHFSLSVFPGLCNMHSHAPMTLFRGLGDDQPLHVWLNEYIWPAEQQLTDELVYKGTLQACREMLASGTTFVNDMYFRLPAMARAVEQSGIRAQLGLNLFGDANELDDPEIQELLTNHSPLQTNHSPLPTPHSRITYTLAPHSVYTVTPRGLQRAAQTCKQLGLKMHIHMNETEKEVADCLAAHGCRPWELLDRLGILDLLGPDIIAAHCLHLSDNELQLVGEHHVTCVHCPNSNLKLGSGYRFPMQELLDAGACVALGTDGSASSNNLDMIEVMKTAALLQKGWRHDPTAAPAAQMLRLATLGHTIAPGQPADLFLVETDSLSNLVYATHGEKVRLTMVDGQIVYPFADASAKGGQRKTHSQPLDSPYQVSTSSLTTR